MQITSSTLLTTLTSAALSADGQREDAVASAIASAVGSTCAVDVLSSSGTVLASASSVTVTAYLGTRPCQLELGPWSGWSRSATGTPAKLAIRNGSTTLITFDVGETTFTGNIGATFTGFTAASRVYVNVPATLDQHVGGITDLTVPCQMVVTDYTDPANPVASRPLFLRDSLGTGAFVDPKLATDCPAWTKYGAPSAAQPIVVGGIQFGAVRYHVPAGGAYSGDAHRVKVQMQATDLYLGMMGDCKGKRTYAPPFKVSILNSVGTVLETREMHDGRPINDPYYVQNPLNYTCSGTTVTLDPYTTLLPSDQAYEGHVPHSASICFWFGATPSSTTASALIPRYHPTYYDGGLSTKGRVVYNDEDLPNYDWGTGGVSGNGKWHHDVVPEHPLSRDQINAIVDSSFTQDPNLPLGSSGAGNYWHNALAYGWRAVPGRYGFTRRGGRGGIKVDRVCLPPEPMQPMLAGETTRPHDGASWSDIGRNFAEMTQYYPGYFPADMRTLAPIDMLGTPTINGVQTTPQMCAIYYNGGLNVADPTNLTITLQNALPAYDTYGTLESTSNIYAALNGFANATGAERHPRAWWSPDSEHANRVAAHWAAMMYADPLFADLGEHVFFESHYINPCFVDVPNNNWANTWSLQAGLDAPLGNAPNEDGQLGSSRSATLPFLTMAINWQTARSDSVYTRAKIEAKLREWFLLFKTRINDALPSTPTTAGQASYASSLLGGMTLQWHTWLTANSNGQDLNEDAGAGWCIFPSWGYIYASQFLVMAKASGLLDALLTGGTAEENAAASLVIGKLETQQLLVAQITVNAPWAARIAEGGGFVVPIRTATQGAVETDFTTIPTTLSQILANNPNPRSNTTNWFALSSVSDADLAAHNVGWSQPGSTYTERAWRWGAVFNYLKYILPQGAERTDLLSKFDARYAEVKSYGMHHLDFRMLRYACPQRVPSLLDAMGETA